MTRKEINVKGYSERILLPDIPQGPGVCILEDEAGNVLQVAESINIRRRIGELLDSEGKICVHGPKVYAAQRNGDRVYVRWKLTTDHSAEKRRMMEALNPAWD
jgi:hypothetical protein